MFLVPSSSWSVALCLQYPSHDPAVDTGFAVARVLVDMQVPRTHNLNIYEAGPGR